MQSCVILGCTNIDTTGNEQTLDISVIKDGEVTEAGNLYLRFGNLSFHSKKPTSYVNGTNKAGWSWKRGNGPNFSKSSTIVATACMPPNLIGFSDVAKSDESSVIKLEEGVRADLMMTGSSGNSFVLREYSLIDIPKFELMINGLSQEISLVCSINFSHFPNSDFAQEFTNNNGQLTMKKEDISQFNLSLDRAAASGLTRTKITVTGIADINGNRLGFFASNTIEIASE